MEPRRFVYYYDRQFIVEIFTPHLNYVLRGSGHCQNLQAFYMQATMLAGGFMSLPENYLSRRWRYDKLEQSFFFFTWMQFFYMFKIKSLLKFFKNLFCKW